MSMIRLVWVNYKRMIKTPGNWLMMFVLPLIIIILTVVSQGDNKASDAQQAAFNIEDKGKYGEEMLKELGIEEYLFFNDQSEAIKLVQDKEVSILYTIPDDFTESISQGEVPNILQYSPEEAKGPIVTESVIKEWVQTKIYEEIMINEELIEESSELEELKVGVNIESKDYVNSNLRMTMVLLIFYILYASNEVCSQIGVLKNNNFLLRASTTSNPWYKITGSIYLALFFIELTIFSLVFTCAKFIGNIKVESFMIMLLSIVLAVCISLSLGFVLMRLIKNPQVLTMASIFIPIIMLFISIMGIGNDTSQTSWIINNIAKFMPMYWLLEIVNNLNLFPAIPILILMALAMFTAGNFKASKADLIS